MVVITNIDNLRKFLENYDRKYLVPGFRWGTTPQNYNYWRSFYRRIENRKPADDDPAVRFIRGLVEGEELEWL